MENDDTFAEFFVADDSDGTSCSSTDLFEGFVENSNIQSDNCGPWERSSSDLIDDGGQRSSRPKRPSAARPRRKRSNNDIVEDKHDDTVTSEEKQDVIVHDRYTTVEKKDGKCKNSKSGARSRIGLRKSDVDNDTTTRIPETASKTPVVLNKNENLERPKSRLGHRRNSIVDKESLNITQDSSSSGKLSRRKSLDSREDVKKEKMKLGKNQNSKKRRSAVSWELKTLLLLLFGVTVAVICNYCYLELLIFYLENLLMLLRPCKINYLVLRYHHVGKKSAAGLYLSPNKNKYNGKKVCVQIFVPFNLN